MENLIKISGIILLLLIVYLSMIAWNWIMPVVAGLPQLNFWQVLIAWFIGVFLGYGFY